MPMTAPGTVLRWPGKSASPTGIEHPALWHMLDVAAVAERLLEPLHLDVFRRDMIAALVALHDLGKISASFRDMIREGEPQTFGRHWEVTELWLQRFDEALAPRIPGSWRRRHALYAAVAGHHGRPPSRDVANGQAGNDMHRAAGLDAEADARACLDLVLDLWPHASIPDLGKREAAALSWWLPGLIAAADWIGSNERWFEPRAFDGDPALYLAAARERARDAVAETGIGPVGATGAPLFAFPLRPMQRVASRVELPEGPALAILEDETGSGKTEAALLLAQRMMMAGKGAGLFFALPTMATADAMFGRLVEAIPRMFAGSPSLALAHGRSVLSEAFRALPRLDGARTDDAATTDWLRDDRRRSLLANVGVGTVDQALLAVLRTRFSTLRHYALSSKLLVVDEVHELGEPYMAEELAHLLRAHARAGGSAILMTATLPLQLRARLVDAFEAGAGRNAADAGDPAYPALTVVGGGAERPQPAPVPDASPRGPVRVERLCTAEAALDLLEARAREGAACIWIRNAVDDVMSGADRLRARGLDVDILHARFALSDRKRHEAAALRRFGKARDGGAGRILLSSQVAEMSLDLDLDCMVSDLAPMAALIQRAGRLWRHMDRRPRDARPVPGPVLHVVAPDPDDVSDDAWLHGALDRGAWTYDVAVQWRTARILFDAGAIDAPGGLRALIEAVHGAEAIEVPGALVEAEMAVLGEGYVHRAHAVQNLIEWDAGYRAGAGADDDADFPTRLGREERTLALARRRGDGLDAWAGGTDAEAWMLSELRAAERKLRGLVLPDQGAPGITTLKADWPDWRRAAVTVCPVDEDGAICAGLSYDPAVGLQFGR